VPPACGDPPKLPIKDTDALVLHSVSVPSVPAFVEAFSVTVTVAVAFEQGAVPVTVYVYTPGPSTEGS
jgi:hypothetical protein